MADRFVFFAMQRTNIRRIFRKQLPRSFRLRRVNGSGKEYRQESKIAGGCAYYLITVLSGCRKPRSEGLPGGNRVKPGLPGWIVGGAQPRRTVGSCQRLI